MNSKLAAAAAEVQHAEVELAREHRKVGERHRADHDVFHLCGVLAQQCQAHADRLRALVAAEGVELPDEQQESAVHDAVAAVRRKSSELMGRTTPPGQLLLEDLRGLYALTAECEAAWTILGQGAKATRDAEMIELTSTCCEEIVGQSRWIKSKLKLAAPQVLAVG